MFNVSLIVATNGTFQYNWTAYGNGTLALKNFSDGRFYTVLNDMNFPQFSDYWDNNASLVGSGDVILNVTVSSTNSTVWVTFNNTNYPASNHSDTPTVFNVTILNYGNGTFIYNWTSWGNGTDKNKNSTVNFYYTINNSDTQNPNILITFPLNNTNYTNYALGINFTYSDNVNFGTCWWSDNYGVTNISNPSCLNLTGSWVEGINNVTIYVNDTSGNENSSSVRFTIDTIKPNLIILSPLNNTNTTNNLLEINFSVSDIGTNPVSCWYSNDSYSKNTSIICGTNITGITWAEGKHNLTIYVNDSAGNENNSKLFFTVDSINPFILITTPTNGTNSSSNTLNINYSISDANLGSCWYSNGTYLVNYTINNCLNLTSIIWGNGETNLTIWVNDTFGNVNSSSVYFTIDTFNPNVTLIFPTNNTFNVTADQNFTFNATDNLGIKNATIYIYNRTDLVNTTTTNFVDGTVDTVIGIVVTLATEVYNWFVEAFDWAGNVFKSRNNTLTIDIDTPFFLTIPDNVTINYTQGFGVDFDANDSIFVYYSINETSLFTINQSGFLKNKTSVPVGLFEINVTINDTTNNQNSSTYLINVSKHYAQLSLTFNKVSPLSYPNSFIPTCSICKSRSFFSVDY
ncbi:hypothetical protein CCP1ISM_590001 [Azospirillaceae bacterium]